MTGHDPRPAPLLTGYRFAVVAVADNGQEPAEPVEIGIIHIDDGRLAGPCRTWLVRPTQPIACWATRDHGLTDTDVDNAPKLTEIAKKVQATVGDRILVAHRGTRCADLLRPVAAGLPCGPLDVRCLSTRVWPLRSRSLGELLHHTQLKSPGTLGRAGHDATATALLFLALARDIDRLAQRHDIPVPAGRLIEWATPPTTGPAW